MLTEDQQMAAALLARMPESQRRNAERLGYVALGLKYIAPSFVATTVDINPEILAEEQRLRTEISQALVFDI